MNAFLHYLVILAGLLVIWTLTSWQATLWVTASLIASLGTHSIAHLISEVDRYVHSRWTLPLLFIFPILSLLFVLVLTVIIFFKYSWIPALGLPLSYLAYFAVRQDPVEALKPKIEKVRRSLLEDLTKRASGQLTQRQLEERSALILQEDLPHEGYNLETLYGSFLEQRDLPNDTYRSFLSLLDHCLSEIEGALPTRLHREVNSRLSTQAQS